MIEMRNCGSYLAFVCFCIILLNVEGAVIYDIDWITAQTANTSVPIGHHVPSGYESQAGLIQHWSSGKFIHTHASTLCPTALPTMIGVHAGSSTDGKFSFKFVPVFGHYGYVMHSCENVVLHPSWGSVDPGDLTLLELHDRFNAASLFTVDEEEMRIMHRNGKILHPNSGSANPGEGDRVVLHGMRHDAARFRFVDPETLVPISVYPKPELQGTWRVIYGIIDPLVDHEYKLSFTIGASISKSATEGYEWSVSAGVAFGWFQASTEHGRWAEITETVTWEAEIYRELTIKVPAGITVITWQYFFEAEQFGDGLRFRSTILADTDDINKPPQLEQVLAGR